MTATLDERAGTHRRRDASATLAARIVEHIASENLAAGTHLVAQDLAERFTVSRWPINGALKLLLDKGLVEHRANQGYFVASSSIRRAEDAGLTTLDHLSAAYFKIAEDRLDGALPDQVSETYLQKTYGLSRTSLSELMSRIAQEGWVERRTGYGWIFSPVLATPEALEQTYHLRIAIEPAAILDPGFSWNAETSRQLRATETRLLAGAIETIPPAELYDRGVRFHEAIVGASQNPFLLDALRRVNRIRRLLVYRSMIDRARYYRQAQEHLQILDLLDQGRQQEAAEALRTHLLSVTLTHRESPELFKR
ncbi:GntR family transcriptional regulator [Bosea sp. BK604]|uniref:GntR family transcriptional regulator n=1 Tax=Bosea sp. BK604 TaxID=2512180 RepID=UPI00104F804D|nr:GntR family transcriptional regulator [Bosea sp. BK604]TCR64008.1 DNA-binding GntR family transcriptional regulator [Bosea sp. BK604]